MKQHRSMFMLFVRGSVYPVMGLLGVMCVIQTVLFRLAMNSSLYQTLEDTIVNSRIHWVYFVAFWILVGWMSYINTSFSGAMEYTLERLRVSPWAVVGWSCVCSYLWFLIFWLVEGLLVLGLSQYYLDTRLVESRQALFLACYRSEFLHSLIPLREWTRWGRNVALAVGVGVSTGCCVGKIRKGGIIAVVTCATIESVMFMAPPCNGSGDALLTVCALVIALVSLILVHEGKGETGDEEKTD